MATVDKAFRIKNGLVVEGSSATVNGSNVLTEASTEFLQDTTADMFLNGTHTDISFTYNDSTGTINAAVSTTPTFADKITFEGSTPDAYELVLQVVDPTQDVTVTLPNATDTLVGKATTDTFTNKTFDTGDTGNVFQIQNNTISSYAGSGDTVILQTNPTINNLYVNTGVNLNGATTGITTLVAANTAAGTITFPAVTGTVTLNDASQTLTNKTISSTSNTISVTSGNVTDFTEASVDAVAAAIAAGTQTNITITYNDEAGTLSFNASGGVSSIAGTENEVTVSASTGAVTIGLPDNVTIGGNITINGTPTNSTHAATVGYVDAVAQGLHIHASCVTATTSNIDLSTDLQAGDIIDGVTLVAGDRVLVKNQSTTSQNGIYLAVTSGVAVRASDFDTAAEIQGGDFTFVTGGTVNDNTGWVQTEKVTTLGTDPIVFTQFSGAGTYNAGNGLTLTGNVFSINTGVTVDLNTAQTLTNKTLTSPVLNTPSISGPLVLGNNIVIEGTDDSHETTLTFTDPTQDNIITFKNDTGTVAFTADIESAVDGFGNAVTSTTGISVSYAATSNVLTIGNTGVTSLAGTTDQVSVSGSTGSVTLSLPQNIATTSSPTFAGLSVGSGSLTAGSVTLADALIGTATTSIVDTSATVVDTWAAASYNSAKYIVQMKNGNDIEVLEVLVTLDGNNNVYLTEYADVISNAQLGTTNADYLSGNVRLLVTSINGTTVKVHKTLIEA